MILFFDRRPEPVRCAVRGWGVCVFHRYKPIQAGAKQPETGGRAHADTVYSILSIAGRNVNRAGAQKIESGRKTGGKIMQNAGLWKIPKSGKCENTHSVMRQHCIQIGNQFFVIQHAPNCAVAAGTAVGMVRTQIRFGRTKRQMDGTVG